MGRGLPILEPDRPDPRRRPALGRHRASRLSRILDWIREAAAASNRPTRPRGSRPTATRPATSPASPTTAIPRRSGIPNSSAPRPAIRTSWSSTWARPERSRACSTYRGRIRPTDASRISRVRVSPDGKTWGEPIARGRWDNDPAYKYIALPVRPRALRPAPRPVGGGRPAIHERRRGRRRIQCRRPRDPLKDRVSASSFHRVEKCTQPLTPKTLQRKVNPC